MPIPDGFFNSALVAGPPFPVPPAVPLPATVEMIPGVMAAITHTVDRDLIREVQLGAGSRAVVACGVLCSGTSQGADVAGADIHHADAVVSGVRDVLGQAHADRAAMHHRHPGDDDAILPRWLPNLGLADINLVFITSQQGSKFVIAVSMLIDPHTAGIT